MRLPQFQILFQQGVSVPLNWDLLEEAEAIVDTEIGDSRDDLGRLLTAWTVDEHGVYSDTPGTHGCHVSVRQAAEDWLHWPGKRPRLLDQCRADLTTEARHGQPLLLSLPVYAVGSKRLLLDGTNRAVAAYLTGLPVRLLLVTVSGPVDAQISPVLGSYAPAVPRQRRPLEQAWNRYLEHMLDAPPATQPDTKPDIKPDIKPDPALRRGPGPEARAQLLIGRRARRASSASG